ncbi:MAG TPA: ABC transporter substrate-binding protein [Abditibacteriaceae bacterium]
MHAFSLRSFSALSGAVALAAFSLGGCKSPEPTSGGTNGSPKATGTETASAKTAKPYTGDDILLGEYGSLTGSEASFGQSTHKGIMMAVDELNAKGGVLNKKIRVQTEDDGGQTTQVQSVVRKLIDQDNVFAILGEVASSNSLAAAPICQAAGVPMLSPSSTNPKVTQKGDYIFRNCFTDIFVGTAMARFAKENLKAKSAALLIDGDSDYSKGLRDYFSQGFKAAGGTVATTVEYVKGDKDFRAPLTKIKAANPDIIFIPGYYTDVANIAVQARSLGLKQTMMGSDGWDSPKLFEIGKSAVQGSYISNHYSPSDPSPRVRKFVADFEKKYKETPDALAAVGYDAAMVMCDAIKRAGELDRAKLRDALAATKNFPGVTGSITMDKDRNAQKPLAILQIQGNGYKFVTNVKPQA